MRGEKYGVPFIAENTEELWALPEGAACTGRPGWSRKPTRLCCSPRGPGAARGCGTAELVSCLLLLQTLR